MPLARIDLLEHTRAIVDAHAAELYQRHVDPKRPVWSPRDRAGADSHAEHVLVSNQLGNLIAELRAEAGPRGALTELPRDTAALFHPDGCCVAPAAIATPA